MLRPHDLFAGARNDLPPAERIDVDHILDILARPYRREEGHGLRSGTPESDSAARAGDGSDQRIPVCHSIGGHLREGRGTAGQLFQASVPCPGIRHTRWFGRVGLYREVLVVISAVHAQNLKTGTAEEVSEGSGREV